jgi:hypothetical protein
MSENLELEQKENEKKEENMVFVYEKENLKEKSEKMNEKNTEEKDTKKSDKQDKQQEENLKLWSKVEKTNPQFTKHIAYGQRKFTAIAAYYQIKMATQIWGSYGSTWGLRNSELIIEKINNTDMALYKVTFFYPNGEFEIRNSIKVSDDEFLKKLETDTLTKALSRLGFNADVFMGFFDDSRYVESLKKEFQSTNSQQPQTSQQQSVPNTPKPDQPQKSQPASQPQQAGSDDLESLGIIIKTEGNLLIADGDTFNHKGILKTKGFIWDSNLKKWVKKIA